MMTNDSAYTGSVDKTAAGGSGLLWRDLGSLLERKVRATARSPFNRAARLLGRQSGRLAARAVNALNRVVRIKGDPMRPGMRNFTHGLYLFGGQPGKYLHASPAGKVTQVDLEQAPVTANLNRAHSRGQLTETSGFASDYDAAVDQPGAWKKYQEYLKSVPVEDIRKFYPRWGTRRTAEDIRLGRTDARSPEEYTGATFVQGPPRDGHAGTEGSGIDNGYFYISPPHAASPAAGSQLNTPLGKKSLETVNYGRRMKPVDPRSGVASWNQSADGPGPGNRPASAMMHEKRHANQNGQHLTGVPSMMDSLHVQRPASKDPYVYQLPEQTQGAGALNTAFLAAQNHYRKHPGKLSPAWREILDKYDAYGTRDNFIRRNHAILGLPDSGETQNVLGQEAVRALAGYDSLLRKLKLPLDGPGMSGWDPAPYRLNGLDPDKGSGRGWFQEYIRALRPFRRQLVQPPGRTDDEEALKRFNDMYWMTRSGQGRGNYKHASLGAVRLLAAALGGLY